MKIKKGKCYLLFVNYCHAPMLLVADEVFGPGSCSVCYSGHDFFSKSPLDIGDSFKYGNWEVKELKL